METIAKRSSSQITSLDLQVLNIMRNGNNNKFSLSEKSVESYCQAGSQFNDYLQKNNLVINIDSVKSFLSSENWKSSTVNLKRQALINLLSNQKNVEGNYFLITAIKEGIKKEVKRAKIDNAKTDNEYLTSEKINELKTATDKKTALMIEFFFESGCRISEMINIRVTDIELNGKAKIKVIGKGNKQRTVYVKKELIEAIISVFKSSEFLFETRNGTKYNRINLTKKINKVGRKIDLKIHAHTFRHSTAMHLKSKGASAEYIQKYLGHSRVATTIEHYFHGKPGEEITDLF